MKYSGGILKPEARALVMSLKRIAASVFGHDVRQLLLSDNMSVVLAFDRSRARNYTLLKQIRLFQAYCLARNIQTTVRWVPSELNSADEPSRVEAADRTKSLTHVMPSVSWPAGKEARGSGQLVQRVEGRAKAQGKVGTHPAGPESEESASPSLRLSGEGAHYPVSLWASLQFGGYTPGPPGQTPQRRQKEEGEQCWVDQQRPERESDLLAQESLGRTSHTAKPRDCHQSLEQAGGRNTAKAYADEVKAFLKFAQPRGLMLTDAKSVDDLMLEYLNNLYIAGHQAYKAERLLAGFVHRYPDFGRLGGSRLLRTLP